MPLVWLDGALVPREDARVSVDDLGFLYGAACFETMRAFGGAVFRLHRHLARLQAGLDALDVVVPGRPAREGEDSAAPSQPRGQGSEGGASGGPRGGKIDRLSPILTAAIEDTLRANDLRDARVRLTVSAGRGSGRPDLSSAKQPTVLVVAEPSPPDRAPARLTVASFRIDEARPLAFAKHANYLVSLLALSEARAAGCDDALLLNRSGRIAEAATSNLFAVFGGVLVTPPLADGPLPGVTREAILECAASIDTRTEERSLTMEELARADEVFVTNSVVGVRPVARMVEGWEAHRAPGPLTERLATRYLELVRHECGLED